MRGEWWIDEHGSALFADGDQSEMDHEGYVTERLTREILEVFEEDHDGDLGLLSGWKAELVKWFKREEGKDFSGDDLGLWDAVVRVVTPHFGSLERAKEAVAIADARGRDARDYAIHTWGWIRVAGTAVQMHHLDSGTLAMLSRGLQDAADPDDEENPEETYYLETMQPSRVYPRVPLADILAGNLSAVFRHADRGYGFGGVGRRDGGGLEGGGAQEWHLAATCVSLGNEYGYEIIRYLVEHSRKITFKSFVRAVGSGARAEMEAGFIEGQRLKDHWAYGYRKSKLPSGTPVYYVAWSGVEHIFTPGGELDKRNEGRLSQDII